MVILILRISASSETQTILKCALLERYCIQTIKNENQSHLPRRMINFFFSKFWCPEIKRMPQKVTCSPFSTDVFKDIFLIKSFRIFLPSLIAVKLSFKQQIINYKIKSNYQISWQLRGHVCIPNPLILIMIIWYALSIKC